MQWEGQSILVTGGYGAIGSALSRELLKGDISKLTILDDFSSSVPAVTEDIRRDSRVTSLEGSVVSDAILSQTFREAPDTVFHFAANFANQNSVDHPVLDTEVNSVGTMKVLEHSRKSNVSKLVFASSSCVYGNAKSFAIDTRDFHLDTPYAINKLHGEYLVKFYHDYHGMNTTILRFFNSFGPGELPGLYRNVIPNFFALAMAGKPLPITGDPEATRDFNYIENAVAGSLLAAEKPVSNGKIYNIGSGRETSIGELAKLINLIADNKAGTSQKERRAWDTVQRRVADISETEKDLGYEPVVDLENQLKATYEWLKQYQKHFPVS
ncbi:MAG: NAD-dependent epimerase/dehydratase family protein [Patescibacteria group bacterium]